jgi:hypothetical protein
VGSGELMETSKKLLLLTAALAAMVTAVGIVLACFHLAVELMAIVIPIAWSPFDLAVAFYYWKAKNENRAKYQQRFMTKWAKEYGAEYALRAAETVLKD